jgi:LPXTG-site transpeptidase (sortase) family protein
MADGAYVPIDGLIDRSRFRTDFSSPSYRRREVSNIRTRLISDFAPNRSVARESQPATNRAFDNSNQQALVASESEDHLYSGSLNPVADINNLDSYFEAPKLASTSKDRQSSNKTSRAQLFTKTIRAKSKLQISLIVIAAAMVATGGYLSLSAWQANRSVQVQATKLTQQANQAATHGTGSTNSSSQAISTVMPSAKAFTAYAVAPNLAKYLKIPAIGVDARVLQVGVLSSGALGTPDNVFDTAWYTGSAQPGQPGATLIDGHVSSWTSHGVFYNLHNLKAGDTIQIVKGDNSVVNYVVMKTQVYSAGDVNMQAAITPITPSVSGLNLITCTGRVIKGTSNFNQRVVVFAQEVQS